MFVCPPEKQLPKTIIGLIISVLPSVRPHEVSIPFRKDFHEIWFLGFLPHFIETLLQNGTKITDSYIKTYLFYVYDLA